MKSKTLFKISFLPLFLALSFISFEVQAQNQLGGHFGVVQPLATFQDGDNPNHFDPYTIGFPMGITVRKNEKFAYDLEIVSFISFGDNADFAEFVLPVRTGSGGGLSVTAALHLGVGF